MSVSLKTPSGLISIANLGGTSSGGGTLVEVDPTVPTWAKQDNKPNYNASEVGAVSLNDTLSLNEIDSIFNAIFTEGEE